MSVSKTVDRLLYLKRKGQRDTQGLSRRTFLLLRRNGYHVDIDGKQLVDVDKIRSDVETGAIVYHRGMGEKSLTEIVEWLEKQD